MLPEALQTLAETLRAMPADRRSAFQDQLLRELDGLRSAPRDWLTRLAGDVLWRSLRSDLFGQRFLVQPNPGASGGGGSLPPPVPSGGACTYPLCQTK